MNLLDQRPSEASTSASTSAATRNQNNQQVVSLPRPDWRCLYQRSADGYTAGWFLRTSTR
jgi:hypothetical protein